MSWPAVLCACLMSGGMYVLTPRVLPRLIEPADDPAKIPYVTLGTRRFVIGVTLSTLGASLLAFTAVPAALWPLWVSLTTVGVLLGWIDAYTSYLPRTLTQAGWLLAALGMGAAALTLRSWQPLLNGGIGAAAAGAFFWLMWLVARGALGFGDVRLAVLLGAVTAATSWTTLMQAFVLGSIAGVVWGVVITLRRGHRGEYPYGPGLLIGPFAALAMSLLT